MCSELFRIPIEWNGVPIFGIGVLLLLWLVGGALAILYSGKRTNWSAETWGFLPGLALGAAAIVLVARLFPQGLPIRGFGVMVLSGSIAAIWLLIYRARRVGLSSEVIMSLAFGLFIGGILGARLFFVIEYWDTRFYTGNLWTTLLEVVKFTEGGLVFYGSMIGGAVAYFWLTHQMKLPALALGDLLAPSLLVGLAFGRFGCLLNGCCYGGETDKSWAVTFPRESVLYMEQASVGRMYSLRIGTLDEIDQRSVVVEVDKDSPAARGGHPAGNAARQGGRTLRESSRRSPASDIAGLRKRPVATTGKQRWPSI